MRILQLLSIVIIACGTVHSVFAEDVEGKFIVHEWGTFTTFSGSDGAFVDFRPLVAEHKDLPNYVWDRGSFRKGPTLSKNRLWARVRMETPVTYFYTDRIREVDVRVDFPQGMLTEFYPPPQKILPKLDETIAFGKGEEIGDSSLDWGTIQLIPQDKLLPESTDPKLRTLLANEIVERLLPHGLNEQHYAAARETDSALVHLRRDVVRGYGSGKPNPQKSFFEKFLFYRGVGKFDLPYSTEFSGDTVSIRNDGTQAMNSAIYIRVTGDQIQATRIDQVPAGTSITFREPKDVSPVELEKLVKDSLVAEGLYEKEAASMVKTWQQSWFTEEGTRVLYMVPGEITEELLPLHVDPKPQESLRVLVGRMEVMSPDDERQMAQDVAQSAKARQAFLTKQRTMPKKSNAQYQIPASIKRWGRMTEPALVRISKISKDELVRAEAKRLLYQKVQRVSPRS